MGWDVVEYCELELETGLLGIGGTTVFTSELAMTNRDADCMPPPNGAAEIAELGALFCIKLGNDSEDNVKGGTRGRLEGKEVFVALSGLVVESTGKGNSGWLEFSKLEVPVGKDGLKAGYCIEGGICCWWS